MPNFNIYSTVLISDTFFTGVSLFELYIDSTMDSLVYNTYFKG